MKECRLEKEKTMVGLDEKQDLGKDHDNCATVCAYTGTQKLVVSSKITHKRVVKGTVTRYRSHTV